MKTYHIGLVKNGRKLIVEVAPSVDQLSCELWKYYGERETSAKELRAKKAEILRAVNAEFGKDFDGVTIRQIDRQDYSAGHKDLTFAQELALETA